MRPDRRAIGRGPRPHTAWDPLTNRAINDGLWHLNAFAHRRLHRVSTAVGNKRSLYALVERLTICGNYSAADKRSTNDNAFTWHKGCESVNDAIGPVSDESARVELNLSVRTRPRQTYLSRPWVRRPDERSDMKIARGRHDVCCRTRGTGADGDC